MAGSRLEIRQDKGVSTILEKKKEYNALIERINKAEKYFESNGNKATSKEEEAVKEILDDLSRMCLEFEKNGYKMTSKEILEGFEVE